MACVAQETGSQSEKKPAETDTLVSKDAGNVETTLKTSNIWIFMDQHFQIKHRKSVKNETWDL